MEYSHQAEALDFILRRETGDLPAEMSLWEKCQDDDSDLEECLYAVPLRYYRHRDTDVVPDIST